MSLTLSVLIALLTAFCGSLVAQDNPFFSTPTTPYQTPPFDRIKIEHYLPAFQEGMRLHKAEIDVIVQNPNPATFDNTIAAYDRSGQMLTNVAGVFFSLMSTMADSQRQELAGQITPLLTAHNDDIKFNEKFVARVKSVYDRRTSMKLTTEQLYLLENMYRGFVHDGSLLDEAQKGRLREINRDHAMLTLKFRENVLTETNNSYIVIDNQADLAGLPANIVALGAEAAEEMHLTGKWVFTTQKPSMIPFLQYAASRPLRQALYTAYFMRGDRDNDHDNKAILQKIFTLREERARLLGFATPASFTLDERMAKTPEAVDQFLRRVWTPALNRAKTEVSDMQAIIDAEKGGFKLASWDWWYYAEKLRHAKYDLDDSELRPYFTLDNVRKGAFTLAQKLYGITFAERSDIPVYHPEVKVYEVKDSDGHLLGLLYTDFFPRASKRNGAWSGSFRDAYYKDGRRVIPFATLVCNFTKPTAGAPSLLSIEEVQTLFHEFGHALNSIFANNTYHTGFVPQDAVELPSQIMENWALEPDMLKLYARHYQTGAVIPTTLVDKLKNSNMFNQGFDAVEYLAACFLDMAWHTLDKAVDVNVTQFEQNTLTSIGLIPEILPRYRSTYFTHIHGGYEAGYYSYYWAEVLDADAFAAFKDTSLFDKKTATSFRKNILEKLGTEDAMTLYKRFRGREPQVEPFLKRHGLM